VDARYAGDITQAHDINDRGLIVGFAGQRLTAVPPFSERRRARW